MLDGVEGATGMNVVETARLHFKLFNLVEAREVLEEALPRHKEMRASATWVHMVQGLLRVYGELGDKERIRTLSIQISELAPCEFEGKSELFTLQGRMAFERGDFAEALTVFSRAFACAGTLRERSHAQLGMGIIAFFNQEFGPSRGYFEKVLRDNQKTEPEFEAIALVWLAHVANAQGKNGEGLAFARRAAEVAKGDRHLYIWITAQIAEAELQMLAGEMKGARKCLELAENLLPPGLECYSARKIRELRGRVELAEAQPGFELVESEAKTTLKTPNGRLVDLSSQLILVELLKILMQVPRRVHSKEEICRRLWRQEYHPFEVDNKIYVTIRRLRKALGDVGDKAFLVLTREPGYLLNPEMRFTQFQHRYFATDLENP
jgi:DNA-binding winged helix-turn-helix (wHTH) protein